MRIYFSIKSLSDCVNRVGAGQLRGGTTGDKRNLVRYFSLFCSIRDNASFFYLCFIIYVFVKALCDLRLRKVLFK